MRWSITIAVMLASGPAAANDIDEADKLFEQARVLRVAGKYAEACEIFARSYALNPNSTGTVLNLALCDEKLDKIASAVTKYEQAAKLAREQNLSCDGCAMKALTAAEDGIAHLASDLPHLTITVDDAGPDTRVLVDGAVVPRERLADLPVDPGQRQIEVTAPGRVTYTTRMTMTRREHRRLAVPALSHRGLGRGTAGAIFMISGAGTVAGSIGLGLYAKHVYDAQFVAGCDRTTLGCTDSQANAKVKTALTIGRVATGVAIAGTVAVGVGAYLVLTRPHREHRVAVIPQLTPTEASVVAVGWF